MRKRGAWFSLLTAACLSSNSLAGNTADLAGTYSVTFQPVTSAGEILGCSLVYQTALRDYVYKEGAPVMAVGNITIWAKGPALSLKLGLANLLSENRNVDSPHGAFIRTQSGTTAGVRVTSYDSDMPGYKVFVYELNEKSLKVLDDLLAGKNPTIAFNRHASGLDATFVVDLSVADTTSDGAGGVKRSHSSAASEGFLQCFGELVSSWKEE